jgi:hypothetical protein
MFVKNAKTLAHGGVHLVVLAHLQRRCRLRGGEVWRLPLVIRQRNEGERRSLVVTGRGLSMTGRVRSVAAAVKCGTLGLCTGASG